MMDRQDIEDIASCWLYLAVILTIGGAALAAFAQGG